MENQSNPDFVLVCNACGHDNLNSIGAKNEGETCRQFGCLGTMTWLPKTEAESLQRENEEWRASEPQRREMASKLLFGLISGKLELKKILDADLRLCSDKRMNARNIEGKCADCGKPIFYDPGYPEGPKKICLQCALTPGHVSLSA